MILRLKIDISDFGIYYRKKVLIKIREVGIEDASQYIRYDFIDDDGKIKNQERDGEIRRWIIPFEFFKEAFSIVKIS